MRTLILFISLIVFINTATAEIIAYEGFDYPQGDMLVGKDGGSGWQDVWYTNTGAGGSITAGLSYTDTNGVQLQVHGGANATNAAISYYQTLRDTSIEFGAADTTIWASLIIQQSSSTTGTNYATMTLGRDYTFGSDAMVAGIGGTLGYPFITNFYASSGGIGEPALALGAGESAFIVLRFDFVAEGNDTLNLWFNPNLDETLSEPLLSFSGKNYAPVISGLTLAHGDSRSFVYDEIRIGTDFLSVAPSIIFSDGFEENSK